MLLIIMFFSGFPSAAQIHNEQEGKDIDLSHGIWEVPVWSLKTNALGWLATVPNIEAEFKAGPHLAIDLGIWVCPWKISTRYSLKTIAILPEVRWWLNNMATGHYFNIHFTCGWYNLRINDYRYQDAHHPALGAGIGYGYQFVFNENWGLDLSIGFGYLNLRYDRFYNVENGALIDTRKTSYWGPDRLGVSLVYRFTP